MLDRIVHSGDFERVLRIRSRVSSEHFALHYLFDKPRQGQTRCAGSVPRKLSTGEAPTIPLHVDEALPEDLWHGAVVPKRHARRAVTRTLIKRQIRAAMERHMQQLAAGLWVVRLRSPFDRVQFVSASSQHLKRTVREELDQVLIAAAKRVALF